ncbi:MAG: hypothetical protein AABX89_06775 [Candidatus Thermoplasmatota archaeon]
MRARFALAILLLPLVAGCAGTKETTWASLHQDALDQLATHRNDGRFSSFLAPYAVEAAALGGVDPNRWPTGDPAVVGLALPLGPYLSQLRPAYALALANPSDASVQSQLRSVVLAGLNGTQFGEPALLNDDAFALRALAAAGSDAAADGWRAAVEGLARNQTGGWSYRMGVAPDTDSTGIVLVALGAANGLGLANRTAALAFLAASRDGDGGYGTSPGEVANCHSTVWALRGHFALDAPTPNGAWAYLAALRAPGGWAYPTGGAVNAFCTAEVATLFGAAVAAGIPVPPAFSFES